jgi:hypothetical protein
MTSRQVGDSSARRLASGGLWLWAQPKEWLIRHVRSLGCDDGLACWRQFVEQALIGHLEQCRQLSPERLRVPVAQSMKGAPCPLLGGF